MRSRHNPTESAPVAMAVVPARRDRTGLIVTLTLVGLAVFGTLAVFGDGLFNLLGGGTPAAGTPAASSPMPDDRQQP